MFLVFPTVAIGNWVCKNKNYRILLYSFEISQLKFGEIATIVYITSGDCLNENGQILWRTQLVVQMSCKFLPSGTIVPSQLQVQKKKKKKRNKNLCPAFNEGKVFFIFWLFVTRDLLCQADFYFIFVISIISCCAIAPAYSTAFTSLNFMNNNGDNSLRHWIKFTSTFKSNLRALMFYRLPCWSRFVIFIFKC